MAKKNRIEQPWGYREQTVYQSAANLLRDELNKKDKLDSEQSKLIEELLKGSIVSVEYDSETRGYDFVNVDGDVLYTANLDDIIMSDFVKSSSYDRENGMFTISFENGDNVELDFTVLNKSIDIEKQYRKEGDEKLQELIKQEEENRNAGDKELRNSINWEKQYRKDRDDELRSSIDEEIKKREEGDDALWEVVNAATSNTEDFKKKLEEEIKSRSDADEEIWKAIGKCDDDCDNDEQSSLNERLEEEIKNRFNADEGIKEYISEEVDSLESAIEEEKSLREEEDKKIQDALNEFSAYTVNEFENVNGLIEQEVDERLKADEEIWKAIGKCDDDCDNDEQSSLNERLEEEISERKRSDEVLQGNLDNETTERQNAVTGLENALNDEAKARKDADDALQAAIDSINGDVNANVVKIESVEPSSTNVREEYQLVNANGDKLGESIKVYKDSSLKDVKLDEQNLVFTYIKDDGSVEDVNLDVSVFLAQSEFKKGLEVTNDGIVNVKIADDSEQYLTVGEDGIKLTGIDAIKDASDNGIEEVKTLLDEEKSARESNDTLIQGKLEQEISDREASEETLKSDIEKLLQEEKERAEKAENDLKTALEEEQSAREVKDTEFGDRLSEIDNSLIAEVDAREAEDKELHEEIDSLTNTVEDLSQDIKDFKTEVGDDIKELDERVTDLESSNGEIESKLENKPNADDVYTKVEADKKFASKKDLPIDYYTKGEVDAAISKAETSITVNVDALRDNARKRDNELEGMITQLETQVNSFGDKVETIVAADNSIVVNSKNENKLNPKINVKVAEEWIPFSKQNNLKLGVDGLYSIADLNYNSDTQELEFVNNEGTKRISGFADLFTITDFSYEPNASSGEFKLILKYQTSKSNRGEGICDVSALVNSWDVAANGGDGSIILTREVKDNRKYILSGDVKIQEGSNALKKEPNTGYLYVEDLSGSLEDLRLELEDLKSSLSTLALENLSLKNEIKKISSSIPKQILNTIKYGEDEFIEE